MDLEALRTFLAVAEELHFGRAADRLHLAQQAVSQRVQRLERDLEVTLLHRTTRQVALTQAGTALQADARAILERVDDARRRVTAIGTGETGACRLVYEPTMVTTVLPQAIGRCERELPAVALQLEERCSPELEHRLRVGGADIGIVGPVADPAGLQHTVLLVDHPVLVVANDHPLAGRDRAHLAEMGGERFVGFDPDVKGGADALLHQLFDAAGVAPPLSQTGSSELAVLGLVAAGCGVGIVSGRIAAVSALPVTTLEIEPTLELPTRLLWAAERTDGPTEKVLSTILDGFKDPVSQSEGAGRDRRAAPRVSP